MLIRPRRNRNSPFIRDLVAETNLTPQDFVWPLFITEGESRNEEISSLPGVYRRSIDQVLACLPEAIDLGIRAVALFPAVDESKKNSMATESCNPDALNQRCVRAIRESYPQLVVVTDVAMDPYSSDGHDGVVRDGKILNDESLQILSQMALTQAQAGAQIVACSDMMDGRVQAIREILDNNDFEDVLICSYCIKYASAFYGPFRDALDSAPKFGDKKTYQMDPRNSFEGLREIQLDEAEGADILMVKPGLPYLDVIKMTAEHSNLPVAAYHVSGELSMLKAAALKGWLDYDKCLIESLTSLKRAGAKLIFTYAAVEASKLLRE